MAFSVSKQSSIEEKYGSADHGVVSGLYKLWRIFLPRERVTLVLLLGMIVSLAVLEVVSISSIMPFLAVASNPEVIETNRYLNWVYTTLGFESHQSFLLALGIAVACFIIFDNLYKLVVKYVQSRWSQMRGHALSTRLLERYLARPYVFFLNENSSDLSKNVLSEVKQLIGGYLKPLLDFLTKSIQGIGIVALLVAVQPQAAAGVAAGFAVV